MRYVIRSLPRGAALCAVVALLNSAAWSLLIPPFHVPDEVAHVGYAQYLAETWELPKLRSEAMQYSDEERGLLTALNFYGVIGNSRDHSIWTAEENRRLREFEGATRDRRGLGSVDTASSNPPLYYALTAVPYLASPSARLLDRLVFMRLLSALMAAGTALAIFLFLRELFPGTPWVWSVGALAAAFQPTFGFISGGVNSDNLLFLTSSCLFLCIARAFARGLTPRLGAAIGAVGSIGMLTKFQFIGLVPAVALCLLILLRRAAGDDSRHARRGLLVAGAVTAAPIAIYALLSAAVWHRGLLPGGTALATSVSTGAAQVGGARDQLSFIWQLFLPRLPWLADQVPGFPLQTIWFNGFIGRFGWLDYGFPSWAYTTALYVCLGVLLAAGVALWRGRAALLGRLGELLTYVVAGAGLCLLIGVADYHARRDGSPPIEQARYLLPLLALYAAVVAAAGRLGGRRWGPVVGALLVALAAGHSLFAQLLTLTRYYA